MCQSVEIVSTAAQLHEKSRLKMLAKGEQPMNERDCYLMSSELVSFDRRYATSC